MTAVPQARRVPPPRPTFTSGVQPRQEGSTPAPTPVVKPRAPRVLWVDLLRLLASFQMVHGHTLDALMAAELRHGEVFRNWSWGRGLVSVSFMVAAGIAFSLSTLDRFEAHRTDAAVKARRLRRIAWLVALGYLLHFPAQLWGPGALASLREFVIVDVLQCIGVSILLLQLLTLWLPRRNQVVAAAGLLSAVFLFGAPLADTVVVSDALPLRALQNYLTHAGGSLFPLFPWAGFVLFGVALAGVTLPKGSATSATTSLWRLLPIAGTTLILAMLVRTFADPDTHAQAQTWFALSKLGWVLVVISGLAVVSTRLRQLPRFLQILSGESLMLYVFHLVVLYGAGIGLYRVIGRTLPLGVAVVVAVGMVAVTAAVGYSWYHLKRWHRRRNQRG